MKINRSDVWNCLNQKYHPSMHPNKFIIARCLRIVYSLFPGMECNSKEEFYQIMNQCVIPVLGTLYHWVVDLDAKEIKKDETFDVRPFMGCTKSQWKHDGWKKGLENRIASLMQKKELVYVDTQTSKETGLTVVYTQEAA